MSQDGMYPVESPHLRESRPTSLLYKERSTSPAMAWSCFVSRRSEHSERPHRCGETEKARSLASGMFHEFYTIYPWEWVWSMMPEETRFRREELEDFLPACWFSPGRGKIGNMVSWRRPRGGWRHSRHRREASQRHSFFLGLPLLRKYTTFRRSTSLKQEGHALVLLSTRTV